jgi:hypothetical protein
LCVPVKIVVEQAHSAWHLQLTNITIRTTRAPT